MTNKSVRRGMSKEKWESLKSVGITSRYFFVSAIAKMIPNPLKKLVEDKGEVFAGTSHIPYIQKPGKTYRKTVES